MNTSIELGVVKALESVSSLSGVVIVTSQNDDKLDDTIQRLVVECGEAEHLGGGLFRSTCKCYILTPSNIPISDHRSLSRAVVNHLRDFGLLSDFFELHSGVEFRGSFVKLVSEQIDDGLWVTTVDLLLGFRVS